MAVCQSAAQTAGTSIAPIFAWKAHGTIVDIRSIILAFRTAPFIVGFPRIAWIATWVTTCFRVAITFIGPTVNAAASKCYCGTGIRTRNTHTAVNGSDRSHPGRTFRAPLYATWVEAIVVMADRTRYAAVPLHNIT